ncbi:MAG: glycosyl hydrolase [Tannerellaceae bacterium]|nr:glycosyl hydrolase [Tannerellaceae bacterium]
MRINIYIIFFGWLLLFAGSEYGYGQQEPMRIPSAPLFRDPVFDGAADPCVIYNHREKTWNIFYTNRRANVAVQGTAWVYGTHIGYASSADNGRTWQYRGTLDLEFEPGFNTFWAPHIVYDKGVYHLYVTYIPGVYNVWGGRGRIAHYTSKDLHKWKFRSLLELSENPLLDATVYKKPDGTWGMWYKDSKLGLTVTAVGKTPYQFTPVPGVVIGDCGHEAPLVFEYKGYYWLLTDQWEGFGVYRSEDTETWEKTGVILGNRGTRKEDNVRASHPGIAVTGEKAYIFYFTHPGWEKEGGWADESAKLDAAGVLPHVYKYSVIQVAELTFENGTLICDRDKPFDFYLPD